MKRLLLSLLLFTPILLIAQIPDTSLIHIEVDSLVQLNRSLTGQKKFDEALQVIEAATTVTVGAFGKENALYATCLFNHGRTFYNMGRAADAESLYLESLAIREKIIGKENADYAQTLHNLGLLYSQMGKYDMAEPMYLEALAIREKVMGKESAVYATTLHSLGYLYFQMNKYDKAEPVYLEALAIREKVIGKENADYAQTLHNLGLLYFQMGKYDKAEPIFLKALTVREKVLGKEHIDYAWTLFSLGLLYKKLGDYGRSELFYLGAKSIFENILGKEHRDYALCLNNLGNVYVEMGNYLKAEPLYLEAKNIRQNVLGNEHLDYAQSLYNFGFLYDRMGNYEKAEAFYLEVKEIKAKMLGKQNFGYALALRDLGLLYLRLGKYEKSELFYKEALSVMETVVERNKLDYANTIMGLGLLYKNMGNYEESENLYLKAKDIQEKLLGKEHPEYAWSLNNLGVLYWNMGNYEKSESLLLTTKDIWGKTLSNEHPQYAGILHNLGLLYYSMGYYDKAEPLYLESKSIREKILEKEHPDYIIGQNNLGMLYRAKGDYKKAEKIYLEAQSVQGKMLDQYHPNNAFILNNLGLIYYDMSDYEKSELYLVKGLSIREKILGKEHPNFVESLNNLAMLYWRIKRYDTASTLLIEATQININLLLKGSHHLSERELSSYTKQFVESQSQLFSFAQIHMGMSPSCYDYTLFHKGFLLNTASQLNKNAVRDTASGGKFNLLKSYHRRLAIQYSQPIVERDSATVVDLEEKSNTLEKELTRTVAGYGEALRQVSWQEVQAQLRPGEAAVEFVHYNYYTPKPTDSIMYAALVLLPGDTAPHFVPLFEERQITSLLKGASGGNLRKINECYGERGQELHALIWKPLEELLKEVKTVYCSPSGLLHRLNLGAMRVKGQQTYGEIRSIVTLGSTRQLVVGSPVNQSATATAAVFGGIRYETDTTAMFLPDASDVAATRGLADIRSFYSDSTARGGSWNYLSGTRAEALDISKLLHNARYTVKLDTGYRATEEVIRNTGRGKNSPRILHIATHGFFYPDPKVPADKRSLSFDRENMVFRLSDNPMMRSGLILAGANQAWQTGKGPGGREDGILTAYEISHMDLSGTELVVLSACETGLGDIEGNEGVYGLQRAFKIAGAKYLLMSLWKVNDASTREFMTEFYRLWLEGKQAIPDAFRGAQAFLKNKYPDSPFHWAGFILVE